MAAPSDGGERVAPTPPSVPFLVGTDDEDCGFHSWMECCLSLGC